TFACASCEGIVRIDMSVQSSRFGQLDGTRPPNSAQRYAFFGGSPTWPKRFATRVDAGRPDLSCRSGHSADGYIAEQGLATVKLRERVHPDRGEDALPAVNPIMLEQATNRVGLARTLDPSRLCIKFLDDCSHVTRCGRDLNDSIRPIEALAKL